MTNENKTYRVGGATITKVEEQQLAQVPTGFLFPTTRANDVISADERLTGLLEDAASLRLSVHTWVVRDQDKLILIDTGSGNDKDRSRNPIFHRQNLPFLEGLAEEGVKPDDVDYVINTHLHVDHSGWNTRLVDVEWVPTFPNARYVFPEAEVAYYASVESHNEANIPSLGVFEDSIAPILDRGMADFIGPAGGHYLDIFKFIPTSGHSIGHMSVALQSQGEIGVFGGDIMHSPVQVYYPELNTVFCEFPDQAAQSRERMLRFLAEKDALYLSTHFPASSAGAIGRSAGGFTWTYL